MELGISFGSEDSYKHEDNSLLLIKLCPPTVVFSYRRPFWMLVVDKVARLTPEEVFISLLNSILMLDCVILFVSVLARELIGSVIFRTQQRTGVLVDIASPSFAVLPYQINSAFANGS